MDINILIEKLITEYSINNIPDDILISSSTEVLSLLKEEVEFTIPSFELRSEGIIISSIIFVSENFIAETRVNPNISNFDITRRKSVFNLRFESNKVQQNNNDGSAANNYTIHKFTFSHAHSFSTSISLIDSPALIEKWKNNIYLAFPVSDLIL